MYCFLALVKLRHTRIAVHLMPRFLFPAMVNLRNRTGEQRRRQNFCDKRDNYFVWKKICLKLHLPLSRSFCKRPVNIIVKWRFTIREHTSSTLSRLSHTNRQFCVSSLMFSTDKTAEVLLVAPSVLAWGTATSFSQGTVHTEYDKPPYISSSWPQRLFIRLEDLLP